ncbi:MAG TPA: DUF58 domain-containing protein [Candidatus Thermoplasmatota archaeon]|nr:DUF58 domain-containing protein [Candidatus Thermoplasmatota archaeon]
MITKVAFSLLTATIVLFTSGVSTGNYTLLLLATIPFFALLIGAGAPLPDPEVTRTIAGGRATHGALRTRTGDRVTVTFRVKCPPGRCLVELHQPLPPPFLLDQGSNVRVVDTGRGSSEQEVTFTFRVTKRGKYTLDPARFEVVHPLGLSASKEGVSGAPIELEVAPRIARLKRVSAPSGLARRFFPENDQARLGAQTTDFREIREYAWGDPPRSINWKASARRLTSMGRAGALAKPLVPLVNEYEREGKKNVWLFVDASSTHLVGSSVENALEYSLEAASGVAQYFLDRGYRVGAYIYNAKNEEPLYPESGRRQLRRITDRLVHLESARDPEPLEKAMAKCRGHLASDKPMVVVVSRITPPAEDLMKGIRTLRAITGRQHSRVPVIIVNVVPYHLMPDRGPFSEEARQILERLDKTASQELTRMGVGVMTWDPRKTAFATAWLRGRIG